MAKLQAARRKASDNLMNASIQMKERYDKRRKVATEYKMGDLVLWRQSASSLGEKGINRKIANKYDGPYRIAKILRGDRYETVSLQGELRVTSDL